MDEILLHLMTLNQSDFCGQTPSVFAFAIVTLAHIAIGAASYRWRWIAHAWLAKEVFADIPNCAFDAAVVADSAADIGFLALGLALAGRHAKRKAMIARPPKRG